MLRSLCRGHCVYDMHHRFGDFLLEVVDWLGCRRNVLSDLCCDLFAPGLNIWLSPQAPSCSLRLYGGLSIEHRSSVTLQGLVRTSGLGLMTYSQRHISGHIATLVLDLQSQAYLIRQLYMLSWQNQLAVKPVHHFFLGKTYPVYTGAALSTLQQVSRSEQMLHSISNVLQAQYMHLCYFQQQDLEQSWLEVCFYGCFCAFLW